MVGIVFYVPMALRFLRVKGDLKRINATYNVLKGATKGWQQDRTPEKFAVAKSPDHPLEASMEQGRLQRMKLSSKVIMSLALPFVGAQGIIYAMIVLCCSLINLYATWLHPPFAPATPKSGFFLVAHQEWMMTHDDSRKQKATEVVRFQVPNQLAIAFDVSIACTGASQLFILVLRSTFDDPLQCDAAMQHAWVQALVPPAALVLTLLALQSAKPERGLPQGTAGALA